VKTKSTLASPLALGVALAALPEGAHASLLSGEAADTAANVIAWVVLLVVPVVAVAAFWLVHILPEKIAEKRNHPQAAAIQVLCLLSLAFGGLLWPLAWLWAYTKPVLYKMAYGTDQGEHGAHAGRGADDSPPPSDDDTQSAYLGDDVKSLRARIAELEARLGSPSPRAKGA
jgi:hypothetical protein